jgi:hypothetical protein
VPASSIAAAKPPHWILNLFGGGQESPSWLAIWLGHDLRSGRAIMMKAALVLAGIGALAAMEITTPPRAIKAVNEPLVTETSIGAVNLDDTMTEAGRRELHSLPMSTQPALFINPIAPANPAPTTLQREKTIGPHLRAANATNVAIMLPKSKSKHTDPNQTANTDGAKPAVDFKSR